jgi:hypothetical protein
MVSSGKCFTFVGALLWTRWWYYDVCEAAESGLYEDQMTEAIDNGESHDCLEHSSVKENLELG